MNTFQSIHHFLLHANTGSGLIHQDTLLFTFPLGEVLHKWKCQQCYVSMTHLECSVVFLTFSYKRRRIIVNISPGFTFLFLTITAFQSNCHFPWYSVLKSRLSFYCSIPRFRPRSCDRGNNRALILLLFLAFCKYLQLIPKPEVGQISPHWCLCLYRLHLSRGWRLFAFFSAARISVGKGLGLLQPLSSSAS